MSNYSFNLIEHTILEMFPCLDFSIYLFNSISKTTVCFFGKFELK